MKHTRPTNIPSTTNRRTASASTVLPFHIPGAHWESIALAYELRGRRLDRNWTLDDCAEATGVSRQEITFIENGRRIPRHDTIIRLARGLGCTLEELFAGVEAHRPATVTPLVVTPPSVPLPLDLVAADVSRRTLRAGNFRAD